MSLFKWIFGSNRVLKECPRCLGKGHVDWNDIKRLDQELKWIPGACAYCNGRGKVDDKIESNVPVDASYLVINLPEADRKKIINGHPDALELGKQFDEQFDSFIDQIVLMHFDKGLDSSQIASFFMKAKENSKSYKIDKQELVQYVERVIEKKSKKG
jgi:hypothetical protein